MNQQQKRAIVCGHICLDITPVFGSKQAVPISRLLVPGRLIRMNGVNVHIGGCVANTGLGMKRLGADVSLMGKVGRDSFGELVLAALEEWGCREQMLCSDDAGTSYSVVLAPEGVDRIFLHDPGVNDTFGVADLDFEEIARVDLFHFGYPPLMHGMYAQGGKQLVELMHRVHELGVATSLDLAAVDPASDAAGEDWEGILRAVLPAVDYFLPSAEELAFMIDPELYHTWEERSQGGDMTQGIDLEQDLGRLSDRLLSWGARIVVIKCGSRGLYLRTGSSRALEGIGRAAPAEPEAWSGLEVLEECFIPERICSGTGAGDTTIAAFLTSVMAGNSWQKTMKLASGTGASCVEDFDALGGLRSFPELEQKMQNGWQKQRLVLHTWRHDQTGQCWIKEKKKG